MEIHMHVTTTRYLTTISRCDDGDGHTIHDICVSGLCRGCPVPTDECELQTGSFDPLSQQCPPTTFKPDGTTCDSETIKVSGRIEHDPRHTRANSPFFLCTLVLLSSSCHDDHKYAALSSSVCIGTCFLDIGIRNQPNTIIRFHGL